MTQSTFDKPYTWYQDLFCQELKLCQRSQQDWGCVNFDSERIAEIGRYYLDHPEYSRVGREMLVESILESANDALMTEASLSPADHEVLRQVVEHAIADLYDRDVVRNYWELEDAKGDPNPLQPWLRKEFPAWIPPRSIWEELEQ